MEKLLVFGISQLEAPEPLVPSLLCRGCEIGLENLEDGCLILSKVIEKNGSRDIQKLGNYYRIWEKNLDNYSQLDYKLL